jgi:hypothetical protein
MSEPKIYKISTIKDIFELPTIEQVQVCLNEMNTLIIQARATNDYLLAMAKEKGLEGLDRAFDFPSCLDWIDDGKNNVGLECVSPDGEKLFEIKNNQNIQ